ncbi:DUF4365 domain-containing protein [Glycomyces tarimensis]
MHRNRGRGADHLFEGEFGETYVGILALAARLDVSARKPDRHGIDLHVAGVSTVPFERDISADLQVKTFSKDDGAGDRLVYDGLTVKGYNQLVRYSATPKYLVVVTIPQVAEPLTELCYPRGVMLRHCAYYQLMNGKPQATGKPDSRARVAIPRNQVLDEHVFRGLLDIDLTADLRTQEDAR